jgi:hypothetical protein
MNWTAPGGASGSVPWNIVVLLSLLTLLPALLVAVTPFTRLLIVFHFLRQALGTQTAPSNQTLIGLSLVLTYFLMQPVGGSIYQAAVVPFQRGQVDALEAVARGAPPLRHFMLKYAREKDLALFLELAQAPRPARAEDVPMRVVVPAYILSELKTWISDRSGAVSSLSGDRPGRGGRDHFDRHDAVAPSNYFDASEDPAVCHGRWLEPAGGVTDEEFCLKKFQARSVPWDRTKS